MCNCLKTIPKYAASLCLLLSVMPVFSGPMLQAETQELAWSIKYDPRTFDPAKVDDQASELVRYLTGGVLLRMNRRTQGIEPALAESWNLSPDGRTVLFHLRRGLFFSDGSALRAEDVVYSLRRVLAPSTAAPVAEELPSGTTVDATDPLTVVVHLPRRVVAIGAVFDEIAIEPANRPSEGKITSGSYIVAEYRRGQWLRLARNPRYWKHDGNGLQLPYIASLRLDIVTSPEQDRASFLRGQHQLLNSVPPDYFNLLAHTDPDAARDLGPSLNTEQLWFNQASGSPLPAWEKQWFQSTNFRMAISEAMHRADLARVAYGGRATPAYGFISPANSAWYNRELRVPAESATGATQLLLRSGFHLQGKLLYDAAGHPVKFSILTNAGNAAREKMATLIQQDLGAIGIEITVVTLDFPALIERLMHTGNYESCLLGLANVNPDPNAMLNLWLSSSPNHQWNPSEKTPATAWEATIDAEMQTDSSAPSSKERKRAIDHVQQIVADEQPFIYLVFPNSLYAVARTLAGVDLAVLEPGVVWNIDTLHLDLSHAQQAQKVKP